ncbi:MAG: tRNA preQ1(34) S-adenosylmethionine ribosyltransferase-isomerase QueA [Pyrinomonadaceae bacterium]
MKISDYDYELPAELVAQKPLERRENSRMLVLNRRESSWRDEQFFNFPNFLRDDDVIVLNNTKVFPARLNGAKESGAKVELFLIREIETGIWETLARPAKRLREKTKILFGENLTAKVLEKTADGHCIVKFEANGNFDEILEEIGRAPLPPYIRREKNSLDSDRARYQTVFAKEKGAIAAPTAGLHFTSQILERIKERGIKIVEITLHVGYGTFEPVRVSDLSAHQVTHERCEISAQAAQILNSAKENNRRIIAVGTTTTRALESSVSDDGKIIAARGEAGLTITSGYKFKIVDGLLTNFHLPQSSLLVLVSAFAGHEFIMKAYKHAVVAHYRFYSYGDCMLIF